MLAKRKRLLKLNETQRGRKQAKTESKMKELMLVFPHPRIQTTNTRKDKKEDLYCNVRDSQTYLKVTEKAKILAGYVTTLSI